VSCLSNMKQIGTAMLLYRSDNNMNHCPLVSLLYPNYISVKNFYECPADLNPKSTANKDWMSRIDNEYSDIYDRNNPSSSVNVSWDTSGKFKKGIGENTTTKVEYGASFDPTDVPIDFKSRYHHNNDAGNVSYLYEFSDMAIPCDYSTSSGKTTYSLKTGWYFTDDPNNRSGTIRSDESCGLNPNSATTWAQYKEVQLNHGGDKYNAWGKAYSATSFPMLRCFWHVKHISRYSPSKVMNDEDDYVINISYAGNACFSKLTWETGVWN